VRYIRDPHPRHVAYLSEPTSTTLPRSLFCTTSCFFFSLNQYQSISNSGHFLTLRQPAFVYRASSVTKISATMASTAMRSILARQPIKFTVIRSARTYSSLPVTRTANTWRNSRPRILSDVILRQAGRRFNSTGPEVTLTPPRPQKRGPFRSFIVWSWRAIYISTIGGLLWIGYGVYDLRTPAEQEEPDPSKKTLVVLGMYELRARYNMLTNLPQVPVGALSRYSNL
jgi:hypothetical protein